MPLVSMRIPPRQRTLLAEPSQPEYPWGLNIHLGTDEVRKLNAGSYDVGQQVRVSAVARVQSKSQSEDEEAGESLTLTLQITEMEVTDMVTADERSSAERLFRGPST